MIQLRFDQLAAVVTEKKKEETGCAALSWSLVKAVSDGRSCQPLPQDFNGPGFDPDEPTDYPPGSEHKKEVLRKRAEARQRLFHPRDNHGMRDEPPGAEVMAARRFEAAAEQRESTLREARQSRHGDELPADVLLHACLEADIELEEEAA